jgi:hypothetical protein
VYKQGQLKVEGNEERKRTGREDEKEEKIYEVRVTIFLGPSAFPLFRDIPLLSTNSPLTKTMKIAEREREIRAISVCYKSYLLICIH